MSDERQQSVERQPGGVQRLISKGDHVFWRGLTFLSLLAILGLALNTSCQCETDPVVSCRNSQCGPCEAMVKRAIDGDTIELEDGTKIRYLLVDTTETTKGHHDCYGQEAADYNASLVEGRRVHLDYDSQCKDMFGRLLAYVSVDGIELNSRFVERGFACTLFIAPNGADRKAEFEALELKAKAAKKGMWGVCEEITCDKKK